MFAFAYMLSHECDIDFFYVCVAMEWIFLIVQHTDTQQKEIREIYICIVYT